MMNLSTKQKGVMLGAGSASALIVLSSFLFSLINFQTYILTSDSSRISFCLSWIWPQFFTLIYAVGRVANSRFFSAQDIDGMGLTVPSEKIRIANALLQNTMEQSLIALLVYLFAAMTLPAQFLFFIPLASLFFLFGRILFFWAYPRGAKSRSFGFALTFYPTVLLAITSFITFLIVGFSPFISKLFNG